MATGGCMIESNLNFKGDPKIIHMILNRFEINFKNKLNILHNLFFKL